MDEFTRFYDSVLSYIPRATPKEQDEIRQELQDHLEDHRDLLLDYGVSELEARKRAVESMGDAEEIGRAWNSHLSPFWLWVGKLSKALCILLIVCMILPFCIRITDIWDNLSVRGSASPDTAHSLDSTVFWSQELDIRQDFGEHVIRLYRVELAKARGQHYVQIHMVSYPKNPLHYAMDCDILMTSIRCNAEQPRSGSGGGGSGVGYATWSANFAVDKGLELAEITLEHRGHSFYAALPLDWEGAS